MTKLYREQHHGKHPNSSIGGEFFPKNNDTLKTVRLDWLDITDAAVLGSPLRLRPTNTEFAEGGAHVVREQQSYYNDVRNVAASNRG